MRLPGSRPVADRLVRWLTLTEHDIAQIRRTYVNLRAGALAFIGDTFVSGGTHLRDFVILVVLPALGLGYGKRTRSRQGYPPKEGEEENG